MTIPVRSARPKCPECGFSVFNRRFAKCESCGAQLPTSIVYTADELKALAEKDKADEEAQKKALARLKSGTNDNNLSWGGGNGSVGDGGGDFDFDFSD
jgi:hypothetical protein